MRLLFAITIFSFCALLWVALTLARRIRRSQIIPSKPASRPAASRLETQEFFEAGEFRTPRPLRLEQEIFRQRPRRQLAEIAFASESPAPAADRPVPAPQENVQRPRSTQPISAPIPIRSAPAFATLFGQSVPIAPIGQGPKAVQHLQMSAPEVLPPANDTAASQAAPVSLPLPFTLHRRPPQTARPSGLRRRIDLSHFNKDMGDLTDPYTAPLRGSGTQGPVPTDRTKR